MWLRVLSNDLAKQEIPSALTLTYHPPSQIQPAVISTSAHGCRFSVPSQHLLCGKDTFGTHEVHKVLSNLFKVSISEM